MNAPRPSARGMILLFAACALVSIHCTGDNPYQPPDPYGPYVNLENLWISGFYFYFPTGGPSGASTNAYVAVRENGPGGSAVTDLTVAFDEVSLAYDRVEEVYKGTPPTVVSGDSITLSVGNGTEVVTRAVRVPYAPADLRIRKVAWDISGPSATNTLVWTNPSTQGERIGVVLYGTARGKTYQVYRAETDRADAEMFRVYNQDIPYYDTFARIAAVVCHEHLESFEGNPNGSSVTALAGVSGDWPTLRNP